MRKSMYALGLGLALTAGAGDLAAQQHPSHSHPARGDSAKAGAQVGARAERGARGERRARSDRGPRQQASRGQGKFDRGQRGPGALLQGITLTDAQKEQLKALRTSQGEAMKADREKGKGAFEALREARQRGDTAAVRKLMDEHRARGAQVREQQVAALRNILTAEQRVQFDRNLAEVKERGEKRAATARASRGRARG